MMQNIPHSCRQAFSVLIAFSALLALPLGNMSFANDVRFEFPLACIHGQTCWILNYMDTDTADGRAADFTCGPRTEDGHDGIDIAVRDLATAGGGVAVLAAADGTVTAAVGGIVDQLVTQETIGQASSFACGNMVVVEHDGGWQSRYCHLRQNSLQVQPGQRVVAGTILGAVGLSGLTTWPKLNFAIARDGTPYDPYTGRTALEGCGLSTNSLWKNPRELPYRAFAIYNLGFSPVPPTEALADQGINVIDSLPGDIPSLSFWASIFDARAGDVVDMVVTDPRGHEVMKINATLRDDRKKRLLSVMKEREGVWRSGIYTGSVRITRGTGENKQVSEWAAQIAIE